MIMGKGISIAANFDLGTSLPIDARAVADNAAALDDISAPYEGLIVYLKEEQKFVAYKNGTFSDFSSGSEGGSIAAASYTTLAEGTAHTGTDGLMKFTLTGKTKIVTSGGNGAYQTYAKHDYVALPHTKGALVVSDSSGAEKSRVEVPDLWGKNTVHDTLTEEGLTTYYSDEFYPNESYAEGKGTRIGTTLGSVYTLKFSEADFDTALPKKNGTDELANIITPIMKEITEDELDAITTYSNWYTDQKMSFAWHEDESCYVMKIITAYSTLSIKEILFKATWYFRYVLATPTVKQNTAKIYLETGDSVKFEADTNQYAPESTLLYAPSNIAAAVEGTKQLAVDVNDLNSRVENIEFSEATVGYPDGETDNSAVLQGLLSNCTDVTTGAVSPVSIPAGVYKLSQSLCITEPGTHLKGTGGDVILWCTGAFPAIKVEASEVTIEDLKIYVSKTEDSASAESDDGMHSGIYLNTVKQGIYNLKIMNVDIQGAYRYSTKGKEYSYGIYMPPTSAGGPAFNYFTYLDNVRFFSLYCGLKLESGCNSVRGSFHFDKGENIYNINTVDFNGSTNVFEATAEREYTNVAGMGYGAIINSNGGIYDVFGQCFGHDQMTPIVNSVDDETSPTKITSGTFRRLTGAGIKCGGKNNLFRCYINDGHRTELGTLCFTAASRANKYAILSESQQYSFGQIVYSENQTNGAYIAAYSKRLPWEYVSDNHTVNDFGLENEPYLTAFSQPERIVGSYKLSSVDSDGTTSVNTARLHGMQDNVLCYADKWGSVRCYQKSGDTETDITEFYLGDPSDGVKTTSLSPIFRPKHEIGGNTNFDKGITFCEIPTTDNPIYLDILFSEDSSVSIDSLSRFQIVFNDYICKSFAAYVLRNVNDEDIWILGFMYNSNNNAECYTNDYNWTNKGHFGIDVKGIRFIFKEPLQLGDYNTSGYVGLSSIIGFAGNMGGNAWLPRGGGKIYGDIDLNGNAIKAGSVSIDADKIAEWDAKKAKIIKLGTLSSIIPAGSYSVNGAEEITHYQAYNDETMIPVVKVTSALSGTTVKYPIVSAVVNGMYQFSRQPGESTDEAIEITYDLYAIAQA